MSSAFESPSPALPCLSSSLLLSLATVIIIRCSPGGMKTSAWKEKLPEITQELMTGHRSLMRNMKHHFKGGSKEGRWESVGRGMGGKWGGGRVTLPLFLKMILWKCYTLRVFLRLGMLVLCV